MSGRGGAIAPCTHKVATPLGKSTAMLVAALLPSARTASCPRATPCRRAGQCGSVPMGRDAQSPHARLACFYFIKFIF